MHPFITQHRQAIIELLASHGYTNPRVFGSMARGDADEKSDVDLLVEVPEGEDLLHIVEAVDKIQNYTEGMDFAAFLASGLVQDAVLKNMEVIGEATNHLSENILTGVSDDEYRQIVGLRNVLAQEYFNVDLAIIWDVVVTKLPLLGEAAEVSLQALQRGNADLPGRT